ncbi:MAG: DUF4440 domain-containing protein [Nitrospirae bacterium]|nr:DUF4440 domain-containing protein [Nitrospirota bacterium]
MKSRILLVLSLSVLVPPVIGADEASTEAIETVRAFHQALVAQDKEQVLTLLSPKVLIFESGGAELSRQDYAGHHLGADMEFSGATTRKVTDQQAGQEGDLAWVLTRSETSGTFRDKDLDIRGVETMLLRKTPDGWKIIHIHWSSRTRKSD